MKQNNPPAVIFSAYVPRATEWDTTRGIEVYRETNGSVRIRISSETEREDIRYKSKIISAADATSLGKALLCIPEDVDFGEIMSRAAAWSE